MVPAKGVGRVSRAGAVALTVYIAAIVAANIVTNHYGLVSVGFSCMVTAGTYCAGFALLARDYVHRYAGVPWVLVGITIGGLVSWITTTPTLALASTVAFVGAELLDLGVFAAIYDRLGMFGGALVSNIVSAPVDTVLFLAIAGFPLTYASVTGQFIGKVLWATLVPLALVEGTRAVLRKPVNAEGA